MQLKNEVHNEIFKILRMALNGSEEKLDPNADYSAVFEELNRQTLLSLTGSVLKKLPLSEKSYAKWHLWVLQIVTAGVKIQGEEAALLNRFDEEGIAAVVLKGSCSASFYPRDVYRTFGDVDLFVAPEDYERAADCIKKAGFMQMGGLYDDERNVTFEHNRVKFELHRCFFTGEYAGLNDIFYAALPKRVFRKGTIREIPSFPDAETGLMLLEHMRMHLKSNELGLRQLVDWYMYAKAVCTDEFWQEQLRPLTEKAGLTELALTATELCRECFGLPDSVKWCLPASSKYCVCLLNVLIKSGNFGIKNDLSDNALAFASRKRSLVEWMKYLQEAGVSHWSLARKCRAVRPFAWMYQLGRYAVLAFKNGTGKALFTAKGREQIRSRRIVNRLVEK